VKKKEKKRGHDVTKRNKAGKGKHMASAEERSALQRTKVYHNSGRGKARLGLLRGGGVRGGL